MSQCSYIKPNWREQYQEQYNSYQRYLQYLEDNPGERRKLLASHRQNQLGLKRLIEQFERARQAHS